MNKHFQKVLKKLKTSKDVKALGFSRSEIKGIAAKIADNLDVEPLMKPSKRQRNSSSTDRFPHSVLLPSIGKSTTKTKTTMMTMSRTTPLTVMTIPMAMKERQAVRRMVSNVAPNPRRKMMMTRTLLRRGQRVWLIL